jgi:hypothetical protein
MFQYAGHSRRCRASSAIHFKKDATELSRPRNQRRLERIASPSTCRCRVVSARELRGSLIIDMGKMDHSRLTLCRSVFRCYVSDIAASTLSKIGQIVSNLVTAKRRKMTLDVMTIRAGGNPAFARALRIVASFVRQVESIYLTCDMSTMTSGNVVGQLEHRF